MRVRIAPLTAAPSVGRLRAQDLRFAADQLRNAIDEAATDQDMVNALDRALAQLAPITRDLEELRAIYTRRART